MSNIIADVLRVTDTEANVAATIRQKQIGIAVDTGRLVAHLPGGVKKYFRSTDEAITVSAHSITGDKHTATGLTTGHFLKATSASTFEFGAHGLTYSDVGADASGAAETVSGALTTHAGLTTTAHGGPYVSGTLNKFAIFTPDGNHVGASTLTANGNDIEFSGGVLNVGAASYSGLSDPQVVSTRTVSGTNDNGNGHCFGDESTVTRTGGISYNSFDAGTVFSGSANYGHYAAFQIGARFSSAGTMTDFYGVADVPSITAGTITWRKGHYFADISKSGSGAVTNQAALYVDALTSATNNWCIYSDGSAVNSWHAGNFGLGATVFTPGHLLHLQGTDPVLALGDDANNKGWLRWTSTTDTLDITTRVAGTYYENVLAFKGGNVGFNKGTLKAWHSSVNVIEGYDGAIAFQNAGSILYFNSNLYVGAAGTNDWKYMRDGLGAQMTFGVGVFAIDCAPTGTADAAATRQRVLSVSLDNIDLRTKNLTSETQTRGDLYIDGAGAVIVGRQSNNTASKFQVQGRTGVVFSQISAGVIGSWLTPAAAYFIGVGTAAPGCTLDVCSTNNVTGICLRQDATYGNGTELKLKVVENTGVYYDSTDGASTARAHIWTTAAAEKLRLAADGETTGVKFKLTVDGGYAVKCVAGEALAQGEIVCFLQGGTAGRVYKVPTTGNSLDMPVGVVYAAAAAAGNDVWIVTSGRCYVLPEAGITAVYGYVIECSTSTAGRAQQEASPTLTPHWREVGHWETNGSGNGALTYAIVHFN